MTAGNAPDAGPDAVVGMVTGPWRWGSDGVTPLGRSIRAGGCAPAGPVVSRDGSSSRGRGEPVRWRISANDGRAGADDCPVVC